VRVLILGGTGEARELAARLVALPGVAVVSSLAGRVSKPALPLGQVRVGGFGGVPGLAEYLRDVDVLIDATHPFAATISAHAAAAAAMAHVPLIALRRPGWTQQPGDDWTRVPSVEMAAELVRAGGPGAVFVTTGRRDLAAFAPDDAHNYLVRTVEPPDPPVPPRMTLLLDRGPYTVEGETQLISAHGIAVLVTKDSGGMLTAAKLTAARNQHVPVVIVDRPPLPVGVEAVASVDEALSRLDTFGA
jgi:precorrin-6A/cobalt-precorrin-6A reductase